MALDTTAAEPVGQVDDNRPRLSARLVALVHHRIAMASWLVAISLAGAVLALLVAGSVHQRVGPVDTTMSLRPAFLGDTQIDVPPLGNLGLDTHDGPLQLTVAVDQVRLDDARRLFTTPQAFDSVGKDVSRSLRQGLVHLAIKGVLVSLAGTVLLTLVVYRRRRPVLIGVGITTAALLITAGYSRLTWRDNALETPTYTGLLSLAPAAIGDVQDLENNFSQYSGELSKIVTNISKLYDATAALPKGPSDQTIRVLFVSDIHDNPAAFDVISSVVAQFGVAAVVDTGDVSDHGTELENGLYSPIGRLGVPYVFVRGNHDSASTEEALRRMPNVVVLDNTEQTVAGLRIAGSGDPIFTPDQSKPISADQQASELTDQGARLATAFGATTERGPLADIVLVHEPPAAIPLLGRVPLVLAGHTHARAHEDHDGTHLLIQGSTGGAGLRALEHETPTPLQLSVLYFDPTTKHLVAYDDMQLGGLGLTSVDIARHAVTDLPLHIPGTPVPSAPPAPPAPTVLAPLPATVAPLGSASPSPSQSSRRPTKPAGASAPRLATAARRTQFDLAR